jgi:putative membrane protein
MGMMGIGGFGMMLWMVIFWVLVVGLALWLLSRLFPGTGDRSSTGQLSVSDTVISGSRRALDILKERYARGEITKAEYQEIRSDLKG